MKTSHFLHDKKGIIQPQLEIGKEDDEQEKEASVVADMVMRMSSGLDDEEEEKMSGGEKIQRMTNSGEHQTGTMQERPLTLWKMAVQQSEMMIAPPHVESGISNSKGSGSSLPKDTQEEMGSKIGADFSRVKVHTDNNSHEMNKEIGAKAFTHGSDIYFNKGQYNPSSQAGKHLLAHELTHTAQQDSSSTVRLTKEDSDAAVEEVETGLKKNRPEWVLSALLPFYDKSYSFEEGQENTIETSLNKSKKLSEGMRNLALELIGKSNASVIIGGDNVMSDAKKMTDNVNKNNAVVYGLLIHYYVDSSEIESLELEAEFERLYSMTVFNYFKTKLTGEESRSFALYLIRRRALLAATVKNAEEEIKKEEKGNIPREENNYPNKVEGFGDFKGNVPGGGVSAVNDPDLENRDKEMVDRKDSVGIMYQGGLTKESFWLQFVRREFVIDDFEKKNQSLTGPMVTATSIHLLEFYKRNFPQGGVDDPILGKFETVDDIDKKIKELNDGNYNYSTSESPEYKVDTFSDIAPFGEVKNETTNKKGITFRKENQLAMFDTPGGGGEFSLLFLAYNDIIKKSIDPSSTNRGAEIRKKLDTLKFVEKIRATSYLVRHYNAIYRVDWEKTWTLEGKNMNSDEMDTETPMVSKVTQLGQKDVKKLDPLMKIALNEQRPDYSYIM